MHSIPSSDAPVAWNRSFIMTLVSTRSSFRVSTRFSTSHCCFTSSFPRSWYPPTRQSDFSCSCCYCWCSIRSNSFMSCSSSSWLLAADLVVISLHTGRWIVRSRNNNPTLATNCSINSRSHNNCTRSKVVQFSHREIFITAAMRTHEDDIVQDCTGANGYDIVTKESDSLTPSETMSILLQLLLQ